MSFMLHRVYPWKLFKDVEDMTFGRLTGPEPPSSSLSRLFTSDVPQRAATGDPIHRPPSAPSHTLLPAMGENAPLASDPLALQAEDVQIPRPQSAPPPLPGVPAGQSTPIPGPPPNFPPAPAVAVYPLAITPPGNIVPMAMEKYPAPEPGRPQNPPTMSMSIFEGAKDFTLNNSLINNIGGNATIFKFDGNVPLTEELRSLFVSHIAGTGPALESANEVNKYILAQSIRDLPRAKAAFDDYERGGRVSCFEGTRQALLSEIGEWMFAVTEFLIHVLSGLAGIGKSTVAQTVAKRAANLGILGGSFFFSRNESDRRTAEKFVTTIAFQLCVYNKGFAEAIGKALTEERGAAVTTKDPQQQLRVLILEPLRDLAKARSGPVVIVVDALDECDDKDVPSVLAVLSHLVQALPFFKVILTTRPQPHIPVSPEIQKVFYLQNIDNKIVNNDIRIYLKHFLSWEQAAIRLPTLRKPWHVSDEEIETLVRGAGALFIIASTSILFILDTKIRNPASQMRKLRSAFDQNRTPLNALNDFYTVILRSALPVDSDPDIVERFQAVIGTVILAQDPIPIEPLAKLIELDSEDVCAVLDNLQPVISLSGSEETPYIHHKSFPDYITDATRCKDWDLCIIPKDHHTRIAVRCFHVMNARLKHNIVGVDLGIPDRFMDNDTVLKANSITDAQLGDKIPMELRYSCIYWANHLKIAGIEDTDLMKKLELFGNEHLLHWFEALSWICKLNVASRAVDVPLKLLKSTPTDMRSIFYDAWRLMSRFYGILERSALHTYYSVLPFMPTKCLENRKYRKDTIHNLCELVGVPEQWDALIANPTSDDFLLRVAFSANSSQLVSWTKRELKLWDATSGAPLKTFKGAKIAIADNFSVVAIPEGSTVTLHCVVTDAIIRTLSHTTKVVYVALSFDGMRVAVGLSDGRASLWDRSRSEAMGSIGGYAGGRLEFSPGSYKLAYMSSENGIGLWDGVTGGIIAELGCDIAELDSDSREYGIFTISRDGSQLASLAGDHGLRLWNTENGELIGVAEDVGGQLSISNDGSLLATGGEEKVKLWSWNSFKLSLIDTLEIGEEIRRVALSPDLLAIGCLSSVKLYNLKSQAFVAPISCLPIWCLSFSPDYTRLAAGTYGVLQLWDVPSLKASFLYSKERQSATVIALAFSQDCSRLAAGLDDGAITLWDTCRPRQPIASVEGHSKWISTVVFSPDGVRLASGSGDKRVRLWDGKDGAPIGTLEHSFPDEVTSVAFSTSLLAAATSKTITLWDRETLCLVRTLDQGSHALSFSPDGALLVSAYDDCVTVCAVEGLTLISTFHVGTPASRVVISPDGSRLAILSNFLHGLWKFFDIGNGSRLQQTGREDLNWVPHLHGILISWRGDTNHGHRLLGQFIDHYDPFPVLWIPSNFHVCRFDVGSSMFALGTIDGRILIGRAPTSIQ